MRNKSIRDHFMLSSKTASEYLEIREENGFEISEFKICWSNKRN